MPYRLALAALLVAVSVASCSPTRDSGAPLLDIEEQSAFRASVESSFTAHRSKLESAVAMAIASSQTTTTLVPLPGALGELAINGKAEVLWIDGERFVLLTPEKTAFRTWDGYAYSESGSPPPTRLGVGATLRRSIPMDSHWWWIRVSRAPVVNMSPWPPPSNKRIEPTGVR